MSERVKTVVLGRRLVEVPEHEKPVEPFRDRDVSRLPRPLNETPVTPYEPPPTQEPEKE